jgi:hypothetical protein
MSENSERVKAWRRRHPDRARDARAAANARRGGYTAPRWREADCPKPEDGRCELCQKRVLPHRDGRSGWQRDHDHYTGFHRGWLCYRCNSMLGNVQAIGLDVIEAYLKREPWETVLG